jgi:2-dehydropantoate 2-reductase
MRIAVIGAGGAGGYFGGLLARAGHEVTFLARGATLTALRDHGLTVKSGRHGPFTLPVAATDDPTAVGQVDLILFCVKSYDTDAAATLLPPLVGRDTVVLSVQNGVDNEDRIASIIGPGAVLGATAIVSAYIEAPGIIVAPPVSALLRFGEFDGTASARAERLLHGLEGAGFAVELTTEIAIALWEKFVGICALSGLTALIRLPIGPLLADPVTSRLVQGVMEEVAAVGRAAGVALPEDIAARFHRNFAALPPNVSGSMYQDVVAGRRLELDGLNGTVVRLGEAHDVPTPLNFAVYAALRPYAGGRPALP